MGSVDSTGGSAPLAVDAGGLAPLKRLSKADRGSAEFEKAMDGVAHQFEAVFMNMAMKGFRDTIPNSDLMSNEAVKTFQGMADQQMVQSLSSKGVGLAAVIKKQLLVLNQTSPSPQATAPDFKEMPPNPMRDHRIETKKIK